jgi:hypothetical protein
VTAERAAPVVSESQLDRATGENLLLRIEDGAAQGCVIALRISCSCGRQDEHKDEQPKRPYAYSDLRVKLDFVLPNRTQSKEVDY